jgi:hypothetical protein
MELSGIAMFAVADVHGTLQTKGALSTGTGPVPIKDNIAPGRKLLPVTVIGTVCPAFPDIGKIEVIDGGGGGGGGAALTVNAPDEVPCCPFEFVTVTSYGPVTAVAEIVMLATT